MKGMWKKYSLGMNGLIVILAAITAGMVMNMMSPARKPPLTYSEMGEQFGQGLVVVAGIVVGLVMIVIHFVRGRRDGNGKDDSAAG